MRGTVAVDVVAVVGMDDTSRHRYAKDLAAFSGRTLVPASRLVIAGDPAREAATILARHESGEGAVVELPPDTPTPHLLAYLDHPRVPARLTGLVCVLEAGSLLRELTREDYAAHRPHPARRAMRHTARALLAVTQIEYASAVVLTDWEELPTTELSTLMSLASHLAPAAHVRLHDGSATPFWEAESLNAGPDEDGSGRVTAPTGSPAAGRERPGWVRLLDDELCPRMTDPRVSAWHRQSLRPFHPGRLAHLLDERIEPGEFGMVLRSVGFCRLATRPHTVARWEHVGTLISLIALPERSEGSLPLVGGQELAFLGLDLDHEGLRIALDEASLDDEELQAGPETWRGLPDPFPAWDSQRT